MSLSDASDFESCSWDGEACSPFGNSPIALASLGSDCEWSSDDSTNDNGEIDTVRHFCPQFSQNQPSRPDTSININSERNLQPQHEVLNNSIESCEWSDVENSSGKPSSSSAKRRRLTSHPSNDLQQCTATIDEQPQKNIGRMRMISPVGLLECSIRKSPRKPTKRKLFDATYNNPTMCSSSLMSSYSHIQPVHSFYSTVDHESWSLLILM